MDDLDAIPPSKYAEWAASHHRLVDWSKYPDMEPKIKKYENAKPNAIILTEGWGGIPGCGRFEDTLDLFKANPDTKFVWSPLYVTTRTPQRHQCFSEKIAAVPAKEDQNFKFVDMWDLTEKLPPMKKNHNLKATDW